MAQRTVTVTLVANIGSFVSSMARAGASVGGLGALAGKALGVTGVVGGFAAAVGAASEFESAMSGVQAATMGSTESLGRLREAAMKAGADTQYSATEAADAIKEMAKAGVSAEDILGGGLSGALSLAAAGQLDVAQAAEIASVAMTQFKLSGEDLPHVADLLAAGAGKAMGEVSDLGQALNQAGLVASAAGLSIEETTGTLSAFASAGLVGSDAGTSLKSMLQRLQNPSKEAATTMADLGISMYDANGQFVGMEALAGQMRDGMQNLTPAVRDAAMATIFGSDAVRAANVLYSEGSSGIAEWTEKVDDAGYAAEQAAILNDNLAGDIERLGGAFDSVMIQLGSGSQGPLRMLVQGLTDLVGVVGSAIGWISELPTPLLAGAAAFGAVVLLKGPVTVALASMGTGMLTLAGHALAATYSASAFSATMSRMVAFMGGPIGLAIVGISVGLGFLASSSDDAADSTDGLAAEQNELVDALQASKGAIDANVRAAAAKELQDRGILDTLEDMGIATAEATDAILGNEDALATLGTRLQIAINNGTLLTGGMTDEATAAQGARDALYELAGQTEGSIATAQQLAAATGATGAAMTVAAGQTAESTEALADWLEALGDVVEGFVEPLDVYKGLLQEKSDAERAQAEQQAADTESMEDSWEDFVQDVKVSLDEYATALQEQLDNQANWRTNLAQIAQWAGTDVATYLAQMGQDGVEIVAQMADGTTAGAQRMREQILREIQMGGGEWTAAMGNEMRVLERLGASGSQATVQAIARELGVGVGKVMSIARQYGISLADGINPILTSLGRPNVHLSGLNGFNTGGGFAEGGYTGPGGKYTPAGIVHAGEFVVPKEKVDQTGPGYWYRLAGMAQFANGGYVAEDGSRVNSGFYSKLGPGIVMAEDGSLVRSSFYESGGFAPKRPPSTAPFRAPISTAGDAAMQKEFDEVTSWLDAQAAAAAAQSGVLGSGSVGGGWVSIYNWVKARIPQARWNSTYRAGDPGYHGRGKAVDFGYGSGPGGAGSAGLALINRTLHDGLGANLAELIYDGIGDDRPDLKNGRPLTYSASTQAEHRNHVHAAVYDQGGPLYPGYTLAYNGTGKTEWVSKEFSGGSGGRGGGYGASAPNLVGMTIEGRVTVDGDGIATIAGRVVDQKLTSGSRRMAAAGVR